MSTLWNALRRNVPWRPKVGTFGIEIETETTLSTDYPPGFLIDNGVNARGLQVYKTPLLNDWIGNSDGSLRNYGIEFIMKDPLFYEDTVKALRDFGEKTKGIKFLEDQPSTSVHVHMNFTEERLMTVANFLVLWTFFENILLEFSGETRRSNLFASGIRTTEGILDNYIRLLTGIEQGLPSNLVFSEANTKYSALNVATIHRFGSLEARCFRGTTKVEEIVEWVGILNRLMEFSKTPGLTPASFLSSYRSQGIEVLSDVFGPYSDRLKFDGWEQMLNRNLSYVYRLVSCVKNWEIFGLKFNEIEEKPKRVRKVSEATQFLIDNGLLPASPPPAPTWYTGEPVGAYVIPDAIDLETENDGDF